MRDLLPTSAQGYAAFAAGSRPPTEHIDDDTVVCAVDLPHGGIVTSTLTYLFRDAAGGGHLVDPGWNSDAGFDVVRDAMRMLGVDAVDTVIVTHLHPDHLGMAERIRQEYGASLVMNAAEWRTYLSPPDDAALAHRLDEWGVPDDRRPRLPAMTDIPDQGPATPPDRLVADGDILDLGRPVEVLLTPGHTEGSISLVDHERRRVLTGDHVLPHVNPGLGLGYHSDADPVADYLAALERVAAYVDHEALPGHGYRFVELPRRAARIARHHLRRTRQVATALKDGHDGSVWDLASRLTWTAGWENLDGFFLNSALQQTAMHRRFVLSGDGERWLAGDGPAWLDAASQPAAR